MLSASLHPTELQPISLTSRDTPWQLQSFLLTMSPQKQQEMSASQLRSRRARIVKDKADDDREQKVFKQQVTDSSNATTKFLLKLYVVIATAIIITIVAVLNYTKPRFLQNRGPKTPPYYVGTIYPPGVDLDRDLPRFFQTYSIALPENEKARKAVIKVARSRLAMRDAGAKMYLRAWDEAFVQKLIVERNLCGGDFNRKYESARKEELFEREQDLVMWCLLASRIVEGFFVHEVDMLNSALTFMKGRGLTALKVDNENNKRMSSDMYFTPRTTGEMNSSARVPTKILSWLLSNELKHFESPHEYRQNLEKYLYEVVAGEDGLEHYMVLDVACDQPRSRRSLAKRCDGGLEGSASECCEFIVPENYGGNFGDDDNESRVDEDPKQSLRKQ